MGTRSIQDLDDPALEAALRAYVGGEQFVFRHTAYVPTRTGLELRATTAMQPWDVTLDDAAAIKARAEGDMAHLCVRYPELTANLGRAVRVFVVYDYGMGGVEISRFDEDGVTWLLRDT